ncbi:MAG: hypothetical protein V4519_05180 [Patescibacteria group bacterium]
MATIAIQSQKASRSFQASNALQAVNKAALVSISLTVLFLSYFLVPHVGVFSYIFDASLLFVILAPVVALFSAVVSLRQIHRSGDKGLTISYVALGITSLYFMVALAVPIVLIGTYLLYTYVI